MRARWILIRLAPEAISSTAAAQTPLATAAVDTPAGCATRPAGKPWSRYAPEGVAALMILAGLVLIAAGPCLAPPASVALRGALTAESRP
ncbi:hypothetical protein OPKNFCMD_3858 [Methylobacterium crusticola]|uniref:Uncharacterized protein n=1 Tax=Methylobacterium crusticola TaxID=1697972 RepID=A0ABQ4R0X9_9HYPH|nr:hypothetical protein [Methylobacterium crusticola]GJD51107.1 hypothetical protein OPKNFCMD_3858 [Methylobacterium crusticola]